MSSQNCVLSYAINYYFQDKIFFDNTLCLTCLSVVFFVCDFLNIPLDEALYCGGTGGLNLTCPLVVRGIWYISKFSTLGCVTFHTDGLDAACSFSTFKD